jgi:hypothetical protein
MADILERIGKLLVQAERTNNEAEQDVFFKTAPELAPNYSVELEVARQAVTNKELRESPVNKRIMIGEKGKPLNAVFCMLAMEIGLAQGLRFNIAHNSTYVIAFGFPSDIRVTEAMYAHLSHQMVQSCEEYLAKGEWRGEMNTVFNRRTYMYETKPVRKNVARRCFYEAFIERVGRRLREAKREAEAAVAEQLVTVAANGETESKSTALVLKGKEVEVRDYYKQTSTARGSWRGNSGNTCYSNVSRTAGAEAGSRARLGGQQSLPGARKGIGG